MPLTIGQAPVEVGDHLRCDDTGYEGVVEAVEGDTIHLRLPPFPWQDAGELRSLTPAEVHYSPWDPKAGPSAKKAPALEPTAMNTDPAYEPEVAPPVGAPQSAPEPPPATGAPDTPAEPGAATTAPLPSTA